MYRTAVDFLLFLLTLPAMGVCVKFVRAPKPLRLDRCYLDSRASAAMMACWKDCLKDRCCKAFYIVPCVRVHYPAENADFIKEGAPEVAIGAGECSCTESTGGTGGTSFLPSSDSVITRLVGGIHPTTGRLIDIGVEYADGTMTDHAAWSTVNVVNCRNHWRNRIEQIVVYSGPAGTSTDGQPNVPPRTVVYGIKVITAWDTCSGMMGTDEAASQTEVVSGHMLLSVAGLRTGADAIDQLQWTFDRDCHRA